MSDSLEQIKSEARFEKILIFVALFLFIFIIVIDQVIAYPVIISWPNETNQAKELVYSIQDEYLEDIQVIDFTYRNTLFLGYAQVFWNSNHDCYYGRVYLSRVSFHILQHEIGHIHDFCVRKNDLSTEAYAGQFKIKRKN